MPVDSTHADYDAKVHSWTRMRDFLAGEHQVKCRGEIYIPRLQDQSPEEYGAYVERTTFLNATRRTHFGLTGMVFLKDPSFTLPEDLAGVIETDADLGGNSLYAMTRQVVSETLAVGRCATVIDWSMEDQRPYLAFYNAEDILNWRYERRAGKWQLTMVVLKEKGEPGLEQKSKDEYEDPVVDQIRVLRMTGAGDSAVVDATIYQKKEGTDKKLEWVQVKTQQLTRIAKPLREIPIVFHSPTQMNQGLERPPLEDLVSVNLSHYRMSADHNHGLHFVALPTAWVAGFDKGAELRLGSSVAWVTDNTQARAGFLEFTGSGLGAIRTELDKLEGAMAVMGARLLEQQKRAAETAEAMLIRQAGEASVLGNIAGSISVSMTQVLQWCEWWRNPSIEDRDQLSDEKVSVELNSDFGTGRMAASEVQALVASWILRGISFKTLFWNLQQGEIIPPGTTFDDEKELIDLDTTLPAFEEPEGDSE